MRLPSYLTYSVESDGRQKTQVNAGTSSSTRLQKSWVDWRGRPIKLEKPGFSQSSQAAYVEEQFYDNTTGQLTKTTRTGAAPTLYVYNTLGTVIRSGLDVDNGGALVLASNDRITDSDISFESYSSNFWLKGTTTTYPDAGAATHPITSYSRTRLTGLGSGTLGETQFTDAEGNTVTSVTTISGKLITEQTTVPSMTTSDQYEYTYNGRASASKGHGNLTTKIAYDNLGRQSTATDPRGLVTTVAYYTGTALPYTVTDSASNVISTIAYDTSGRTASTLDAAGKYTRFSYNTRGQVIQQWGDATYPVSYDYDATYGYRTGMNTHRSAPAADSGSWPSVGTADTTTWAFDTPSGLPWKKTDAAGKHVDVDYNQAGKTSRRTLARGVYCDYGYDSATGELLTQTYSDSTPDVTYAYTRSGQADSVVDDTGTWDFVYDSTKPWRQASTTLPSFYGTRYWTALYESGGGTLVGRYLGFQLGSSVGNSADLEQAYTYSADGRFDTLTSKRSSNSVTRTFDYSYLTNTPFVSGFTITGGHNYSVARTYTSNRNLLESIDSLWSTTSIARYDYTYDPRYQRATAKQSGTAFADYYVSGSYSAVFNNYTYNARSELQTAAMYCGDTPSTTPSSGDELPGRRFEYRFDSIGNRQTDGPTGDANNVDDSYTTNTLNQYTTKENNTVRFLGTAATSANVAVTSAPGGCGKKDHAWGADLLPANASTAVQGTGNVFAAVPGGGAGGGDLVKSLSKAYFVPKALQTFTYDDDGNMTQDSVWDYTYDAENRLIAMQNRVEVIGSGMIASVDARKLVFKYDYQGRRVRKVIYGGWNGTSYSGTALTDAKYLYDGWNLIAEFDAISALTLTRSYTWGLDLSGSLTASGGVGALLQIYDSAVSKTMLSAYDGSGNVAALLNDSSGVIEAAYEYDPFGRLLRNEGAYAALNGFRFSSKFTDLETGLYYYGLRYYSPTLGRFINKDSIEEMGGLNLYAFCANNSVTRWDYLGMHPRWMQDSPGGSSTDIYGNSTYWEGTGHWEDFPDESPVNDKPLQLDKFVISDPWTPMDDYNIELAVMPMNVGVQFYTADGKAINNSGGGSGGQTNTPQSSAPSSGLPPPPGTGPNIRTAGTADAADRALVAAEYGKMPQQYRDRLEKGGLQLVVVRGSITEYYTDLKGVTPRGWPAGKTWDSVPGLARGNVVVIATRGHGTTGGPYVPATGDGHGSYNLVFHETAHVLGGIMGYSTAFQNARTADYSALSAYERQAGPAGLQESFAESYANAFGGNTNYATSHPNLSAYWNGLP